MMDSQEVLSVYESIAAITQQMLNAARLGDWELLAALESRCSSQVEIIKAEEALPPMTGVIRDKKVKIIHKILEDDRAIRNITEPGMARLSTLMNSTSSERKLTAYSTNQTG